MGFIPMGPGHIGKMSRRPPGDNAADNYELITFHPIPGRGIEKDAPYRMRLDEKF